jgi:hypothetical protein
LGVVEEVPAHLQREGAADYRAVRVVFSKQGFSWRAFPTQCNEEKCLRTITSSYPAEIAWNLLFNGSNLGQLRARTPAEWKFYSDIGLQKIVSSGRVPTIGQRSRRYGGYADAMAYKPLVANSKPYFKNSDSWKPSYPPPPAMRLLRKQFRKKFPKMCRVRPGNESSLETFSYRDSDVKLVKSYSSKRGWFLSRLHLAGAIDCQDTEGGFEMDDPWFVIKPDGSPQFLDSGIWLVDAGDYDNDGNSELIFSIDRENEGGYELFYDDFGKRAVFSYNFH